MTELAIRSAYGALSRQTEDTFSTVFAELAGNFIGFVDVLSEVVGPIEFDGDTRDARFAEVHFAVVVEVREDESGDRGRGRRRHSTVVAGQGESQRRQPRQLILTARSY